MGQKNINIVWLDDLQSLNTVLMFLVHKIMMLYTLSRILAHVMK